MPDKSPKTPNGRRSSGRMSAFPIPGLDTKKSTRIAAILQERLVSLIDLSLTLKHIHWNVVGPNFIGVHLMLDSQVAAVQVMVDSNAERIATLGVSPNGQVGFVAKARSWDDYALGRANVLEHLGGLDVVSVGVIEGHRKAVDELEDLDLVTQDMLIAQLAELEQCHWFVRAHLEADSGALSTAGAHTETQAAAAAMKAASARRSRSAN